MAHGYAVGKRSTIVAAPDIVKQLEAIDAMFAQTAAAVEHANGRIVLHGIAPATLYFSDRPQRVVGHLDTAAFVDIRYEGDDSFAKDPPNAVLAFGGQRGATPDDVVIELRDPALRSDDLSYAATVLDGTLPVRAGGCTLFIDPLGRPLSPVSVAGMRRRERRREG
jgi:hypothetical protein